MSAIQNLFPETHMSVKDMLMEAFTKNKWDRSDFIGASDIGQCMKKSYLSKVQGEEFSFEQYMVFKRGHLAETIVKEGLVSSGIPFGSQESIRLKGKYSFIKLHPDFVAQYMYYAMVHEVKSISSPLPNGKPRESWILQNQLQILGVAQEYDCHALGNISTINLNSGELLEFDIKPNELLQEAALSRATKLWDCVQTKTEPEGEVSDLCAFCSFKGQCQTLRNRGDELPDEIVQMAKEIKAYSRKEKEIKAMKDNIKAYFEAAGIEKGVADGITLTVRSYGKDTSVAKKLQYENPELYANLAERSETITALNIYY